MSSAARLDTAPGLAPFSLKDAPAFIERQFPVGRLSAEAFKERDAKQAQTLTALGAYWKGRKPLILVRAVVLGCLLPATEEPTLDLDIFLKLMAFDDIAFGRRFAGSASDFAKLFPDDAKTAADNLHRIWRQDITQEELRTRAASFDHSIERGERSGNDPARGAIQAAISAFAVAKRGKAPSADAEEFAQLFPHAAEELTELVVGRWYWRRDLTLLERQAAIGMAFATMPYAARLKHVRRPEECDETDLLAPIWPAVNRHLGTSATSMAQLIEQLGIGRFGERPQLADTFCGGGSIPFEAARMGCDVQASDLNPIAATLTWGAFNIIGANSQQRTEIEFAQKRIKTAVNDEIASLGIEHDNIGNRAKNFLYCLEARCPRTGWMVPLSQSWQISKDWNVVAKLKPDHSWRRYEIEIHSGVDSEEMAAAEHGTIQGGRLVHPMNPERSGVEISTIRGDHRDVDGRIRNRLRLWEKSDFIPRPDDVFQERLYCIQWITKETLQKSRQLTFFRAVEAEDIAREKQVEAILMQNLAAWQEAGLIPDFAIEPGDKTDEPIRTRGWTHWHHLFTARQLLFFKILAAAYRREAPNVGMIDFMRLLDRSSKLPKWSKSNGSGGQPTNVFDNQALNSQLNYGTYASWNLLTYSLTPNRIP